MIKKKAPVPFSYKEKRKNKKISIETLKAKLVKSQV